MCKATGLVPTYYPAPGLLIRLTQSLMLCEARQADTYRRMRKATRGEWAAHAPATNCLWLSYLADTLLARKRVPLDAATKRDLRAFRCAACL